MVSEFIMSVLSGGGMEGTHISRPSAKSAHGDLAGMLDLDGDLGTMAMHAFGQGLQAGQETVVRNADLIGFRRARRVGDGADAHDQQAGATGGAGFVVGLDMRSVQVPSDSAKLEPIGAMTMRFFSSRVPMLPRLRRWSNWPMMA